MNIRADVGLVRAWWGRRSWLPRHQHVRNLVRFTHQLIPVLNPHFQMGQVQGEIHPAFGTRRVGVRRFIGLVRDEHARPLRVVARGIGVPVTGSETVQEFGQGNPCDQSFWEARVRAGKTAGRWYHPMTVTVRADSVTPPPVPVAAGACGDEAIIIAIVIIGPVGIAHAPGPSVWSLVGSAGLSSGRILCPPEVMVLCKAATPSPTAITNMMGRPVSITPVFITHLPVSPISSAFSMASFRSIL